jgi:glycosyltransferase involved in cell wall biosynthesis
MPTLTIAICTWNRAELLDHTLTSLSEQRVDPAVPFEVLIVDNNSTDDTEAVAHSAGRRLPLRYVRETTQGLSHARNRALDESRTDLVLFTDDDVLVEAGWTSEFSRASQSFPDAAVLGGPIEPIFPPPPIPSLPRCSCSFRAASAAWTTYCQRARSRLTGSCTVPTSGYGFR